jgi:hypothetical protein
MLRIAALLLMLLANQVWAQDDGTMNPAEGTYSVAGDIIPTSTASPNPATPTPAPTPTATVMPPMCDANGMPPDPTKPCVQVVDPLRAQGARLQAAENQIRQMIQVINNQAQRLAEIEAKLVETSAAKAQQKK